jgi:hypothetical protein
MAIWAMFFMPETLNLAQALQGNWVRRVSLKFVFNNSEIYAKERWRTAVYNLGQW